ncbi:hypothetical protein Tco_1130716 [Tanacetum coccineum]
MTSYLFQSWKRDDLTTKHRKERGWVAERLLNQKKKKQWDSRIKTTVHAEAEAEAKTMIYCSPESAAAVAESAAVVTRI